MKSGLKAFGIIILFVLVSGFITQKLKTKQEIDLEKIQLPAGFKIDIFAENVKNARTMVLTPKGTLFVGTRSGGKVYALKDTNGDFKADEQITIAKGLKMPNGVAFKDGDLYVAEYNRILRYEDIEANLKNPPKPEVIAEYPNEKHHGWKYIEFGPDGKLYVPVGAPCNICNREEEGFATITRVDSDGKNKEIVQRGIRNTVGFTWHPATKDLWFTDNGRDHLGDEIPNCELNRATKDGMHFGYPYCHQGDIVDPDEGKEHTCDEFTAPTVLMGPHVAPLGLIFYTGDQFPKEYKNRLLIAEHGSWNRTKPIGYQISMVDVDGGATKKEIFASGWLEDGDALGRPVDLEQMPDGSVLVSDDFSDVIYRISYGK